MRPVAQLVPQRGVRRPPPRGQLPAPPQPPKQTEALPASVPGVPQPALEPPNVEHASMAGLPEPAPELPPVPGMLLVSELPTSAQQAHPLVPSAPEPVLHWQQAPQMLLLPPQTMSLATA